MVGHTWRHVQEEVDDTAITSLVTLHRMHGDEAPAFLASLLAEKSAKLASTLTGVGAPGPDHGLGGLADLFGELEDLQRPLLLRGHPAA
ncbi:hypothetical protein [Streptomyces sp. NPDC003090]|uniref:hypothetical protein n=1 Tax=Streptomyces sp. NPDC003090 TaxID=3154274 RepID=UPI003824AA31